MNNSASVPATAKWSVESLDSTGAGLSAVFSRNGDCFSHQVFAKASDGDWAPLLASVEQGKSSLWPPSPTLQEVHIEQRAAEHTVLLAVGRAGKSHWSLSIEPQTFESQTNKPDSKSPQPALIFDVACRVKEAPDFLGSMYSKASGASLESSIGNTTDESTDRLTNGANRILVQSLGVGATLSMLSLPQETSDLRPKLCDEQIVIPALSSEPTIPATIRWKYRIALSP